MLAYVLANDRTERAFEADPQCGADFCDRCGDCLACYDEDPCGGDGGYHVWVVYVDQAADFNARHPEAVREVP